MNLKNYKTVTDRRKALEKELNIHVKNVGSFSLNETIASSKNCENMIGATQIPLGIAGPLKIGKKEYYLPLATTEGALVASVNRGCKAITMSGGAAVDSQRVGATRGPVFKVNNLSESKKLGEFLSTHFKELKKITEGTSHHLTLKNITSRGVGKYRYVRFVYDTQDAMGMNMVTIATTAACEFIEKETGATCVSVAGNFDIDKKPAWLNSIDGRGIQVWAEVTIPEKILSDVLKTTAKTIYEVWLAKCMIGSALSGSLGFNAQFANIIAALFLATGQDLGHVGEGSMGITTAEIIHEKDLYISVYLPDLMVGTVGGGTGLATQKEALSILGVTKSQELAEIVAGAVLAGEISLLSSLEEGSLARAHVTYGRNR